MKLHSTNVNTVKNNMTQLEMALRRLNSITGDQTPTARLLATHLRAHTDKSNSNSFLSQLFSPLLRSVISGFSSSGSNSGFGQASSGSSRVSATQTGYFNLSQGQMLSQTAAAISRASRRYL